MPLLYLFLRQFTVKHATFIKKKYGSVKYKRQHEDNMSLGIARGHYTQDKIERNTNQSSFVK